MLTEAVLSLQVLLIVSLHMTLHKQKHIQQLNFNSILSDSLAQFKNQWSCNSNINSSSPWVSQKGQLCESRHRGRSWMGFSCSYLSHKRRSAG